ncbi:polyprenyl synthetase family protein [Bdellovibrio sp. SKB1291214]|uniref:polyprenyl synthetase family protein n=1 Tax=Bdellovibrio sp. SKB1291214 TaxID=1732569 RepID=UPI000B514FA3|nr:farnesyl diphosphate synthase [Bdellovibrio sp. SKB1291214]UYL10394.1 polyprenyl synthetase family protein [Bdellovibrio sp. SKB1291214]
MDLAIQLEQEMALKVQTVNRFVEKYLSDMELPQGPAIAELRKSMLYSATNGGKRFRPVLSVLIAEMLGASAEKVLPFAAAVEMIHTYSLIHDDLPCMDNDDMRRGKPTNHKVFGEDFALLAGDALLTEAFLIIAKNYSENGFLVGRLVQLLSEAAGIRGMVGGQAIDLRAGEKQLSQQELTHLHLLKTGALIRVAVEGAAIIAGAKVQEIEALKKFGEGLGVAFQVADDVLDHGEKDQDVRSFTGIIGLEETKKYLEQISKNTMAELHKVSADAAMLEYLVSFNISRKH